MTDARAIDNFTTGHCPEKAKPGGCQLHNLHCGYPDCDRRPVPKPSPEAAERALASKDGVQVKALEWDNLGYAHVPFEGRYYVGVYRPGQWEMRSPSMEDSTFPDGLFGSEDAAKAAAQADYDRRIRSALTTPPPAQDAPVGGEMASCAHCNDTGLVAIRSSDGRYLRPGPVPEDARGVAEGHCFECLAYPGGFDGPTGAE